MEITDDKGNPPTSLLEPGSAIPVLSTQQHHQYQYHGTGQDDVVDSGCGPEQTLPIEKIDHNVNPFFTNFSSTNVPDESDDVMSGLMMNNPNSFTTMMKGGRPRYFQRQRPTRRDERFGRRRAETARESFVNFLPAGAAANAEGDDDPMPMMAVPTEMHSSKRGKKRPWDDFVGENSETAIKKLKITKEKPATALLNEIASNLSYVFEDLKVNPKDPPMFLCKVVFPPSEEGEEYVGEGRNKKLAKQNAAEKILAKLGVEIPQDTGTDFISNLVAVSAEADANINFTPESQKPAVLAQSITEYVQSLPAPIDFTSDDADPSDFSTSPSIASIDVSMISRLQKISNLEENPLGGLHALLGPDSVEFEEVSEEGPAHDKWFTLNLILKSNGEKYEGKAKTKKKAKANAAKTVLMKLISPNVYQCLANSSTKPSPAQMKTTPTAPAPSRTIAALPSEWFNEDPNVSEYDLTFSDYVSRIVNEKYEEIMENHEAHISQKVLAGIVMTKTLPMLENGEVVAVTTGTKCIEGDCMSTDGLAVNDCHAEILSTRCLRDFLYSQIELLVYATTDEEREECVFEQFSFEGHGTDENRLYKLKKDVKFHLYISTSPCGDARIFSPKGLETEEEKESIEDLEDSHPTKKNRGVLRAKVEAGEGTIPVFNLITGPQTWDAIVQGNALFTMSCSDKVCRWNVVGVQGALLSNLIEPVYYSSITLGSLHHPVHFKRAVLGRIEALAGTIPIPFKINRAHLMMITHEEKRRVKKSPNHAICWRHGWSTAEILAASKGRCDEGVASRLSKRMAFIRFLKLYKNKSGRRDDFADLSYHEAKLLASDYQTAKERFISHMKEMELGSWISKPVEMDSFQINK